MDKNYLLPHFLYNPIASIDARYHPENDVSDPMVTWADYKLMVMIESLGRMVMDQQIMLNRLNDELRVLKNERARKTNNRD
jgi:hypothetical protein